MYGSLLYRQTVDNLVNSDAGEREVPKLPRLCRRVADYDLVIPFQVLGEYVGVENGPPHLEPFRLAAFLVSHLDDFIQ